MLLVGLCTEVTINIRDQFVHQHRFKLLGRKLIDMSEFHIIRHAIRHYDDERFNLAFGNQIVHNQIRIPLIGPCRLIFSPSML